MVMKLAYTGCRGAKMPFPINSEEQAMDFQQCTEALRGKVGESSGLDAVLKFDCGADGVVVIDGKSVPNSVSNTDREADCTVSITRENLEALLTGQLDPITGFMTGKFTVAGDMSVAMKLQRVV
jgi:putative sterol carrier protein